MPENRQIKPWVWLWTAVYCALAERCRSLLMARPSTPRASGRLQLSKGPDQSDSGYQDL
jgi:hypothetical protein